MAEAQHTWWSDSQVFKQPRIWLIFVLGMISGFPWVMIGSVLSAWLQDAGLSRSTIGFFGAVIGVYSVNFLWSPLIDRINLPFFGRRFGRRRSWILFCQAIIAACCFAMASLDTSQTLTAIGVTALLIATASATQDIAIDAFRIEQFSEQENRLQSAGAGMATAGWWTGYSGLGAIPFFLVDGISFSWQDAYILLGCLVLLLSSVVLFVREPRYQQTPIDDNGAPQSVSEQIVARINEVVISPINEFFQRSGFKLALSILCFIFLFKLGEAFLGRMSIVFYKEIGFSNDQIGTYSKLVTWWVTIVFAIFGSLVNLRLGIIKGLIIGGIAMASSNLMFSWIALVGPSEPLFLSAVLIDGFTSAWSTVAFVAFISLLCHRTFTATQYALMASLGSLGKTILASYSGVLVDALGGNWAIFFAITALMIIPSLLLLWRIRHHLFELEQRSQGGSV